MTATWKDALAADAGGDLLAGGRRWNGGVLVHDEVLDDDARTFAHSEFVGRANVAHTTSAVEARVRRRILARLADQAGLPRDRPLLELGCADGLVTRTLLELGFEQLVSTDIVHRTVAALEGSLSDAERERTLLIADDMMRLPFAPGTFSTVLAWGVLSVTGDVERAIDLAWEWVEPGGHLLLAEPILESVLAYTLVRSDLGEFRRTLRERTRAGMWDRRDERYPVNPLRFYTERLEALPGATVVAHDGVTMLPSLILGGLAQDTPLSEEELGEVSELLGDEAIDELSLWRQAVWLVRKR